MSGRRIGIRRRVLFVAEAVTLAQVVRLAVLARSLPRDEYEVHFACARFEPVVFGDAPWRRWPIRSVSPEAIDRAVRWGLPLYSKRTLRRYVEDDLRVIDAARPDVIVGDLRWSLAVSGPLACVKVLSLANACWSPFADRPIPLPEHPIVRLLGVRLAAEHFPRAQPAVFRWFAKPVDELREEHGLAPLGSLEQVLTWGDRTMYADPPALFSMRPLPASHRFIGPVHWAPEGGEVPERGARPLVYVTLGSSGPLRALPAILEALAPVDCEVLLATAGRFEPRALPPNVRAAAFVRGDLAARQAALVICNGGASTAYQALAAGVPVIGVPLNLDQYLVMEAIERSGAGLLVRSGTATVPLLRDAIQRGLRDPALREGAGRAAAAMGALDSAAEFQRVLASV